MKIKKEKLESIYNSMSSADACKKLGVSRPTLNKLLKQAGIPLKGKGRHSSITIKEVK